MMLSFRGTPIPGPHQAPEIGPPTHESVITKYFGLLGESEIVGATGGRMIMYPIWLIDTGFTTAKKVVQFLEKLDGMVSQNGTLIESGNIDRTHADCTFHGFTPQGPIIPDIAGTLVTAARNGNHTVIPGLYFQFGILAWRQLTVT